MSNLTSQATVDLLVNGQQAQQTLAQLRQNAMQLESAIAKAAASGNKADLKRFRKELTDTKRQIREIESATMQVEHVMKNLDKATPRELNQTLSTLNRQLNFMQRGSTAWNAQVEKIRMVKAELATVNMQLRQQQSVWERLEATVNKWQVSIMAGVAAFTALVMAGRKAVTAFAELDSTLANTRKYTGIEGEELKKLNDELSKIQTRTSLVDLHGLAQEAGRLGKNTVEDVLGYVKAADQLNVALEDLGEGATQAMAKVTEIFGVEAELGTERSLLAVGSTINVLSQNCSAGKGYLSEFTQRMAGVGAQAKMTVPEIMAFASVLDTQGQKVEASATALSKLITDVFKQPEKFATALGVSLDTFKDKMSNTTEGLLWMFESMQKTGGIDKLAPLLKEMGENGARATGTFAALANKVDFVKKQIKAANQAFEEATSCTNEYNIVNNTFQAQLDQAKKRSQALAVELGEKLAPVMMYIHSATYYALRALRVIVDFFIKYKGAIITVTAAIVAYKIAVNAATIATKASTAAHLIWRGVLAVTRAAVLLFNAATLLMTGNITAARRAWILFSATLKASPIGLAAAAITAVVVGLIAWRKSGKEVNQIEKDRLEIEKRVNEETGAQIRLVETLVQKINDENTSNSARLSMLAELKRRTGLHNIELDKNNKLTAASIKLIRQWVEATKLRATTRAVESMMDEIEKEKQQIITKQQQTRDEMRRVYGSSVGGEGPVDAGAQARMNLGITSPFSNEYTRQINEYQKQIDDYNKRLDELANRVVDANNKIANIQAIEPEYTYTPTPDSGTHAPSTGDGGSGGGHGSHGSHGSGTNTKQEETYLEKRTKEHEKQVLLLQISYMKGEKNYEDYINAMEAEDKRYYDDVTVSTQVGESDRLKLQKEYLEKQAEYEGKRRSKSLQEVEDEYKELNVKAMQSYVDGRMNKEEYEESISRLELEYLDKRRNVLSEQVELMKQQNQTGSEQYREVCKNYEDANKEYLDKVIADQEAKAKKAKEIEEKELEERERMLREHNQSLQSIRDEYFGMNAYRAKQEYDAMMQLLDEQKAIELAEVSNLENADAEKLRIEEAYQKARLALARKYNQIQEEDSRNFLQKWVDASKEWIDSEMGKAVIGSVDAIANGMKNIFSQLTTIITAEAEIETAKVERLYDQRVSLAEGNNYKVQKLEKEREAKVAKIKNEAEKKKYKMEVISAIAQTAQGAINAYSSAAAIPLVGYIIAPVAAAAAIAAGMLQVQALKKQQQAAEAQGYSEGGFTPDGLPDTPAGIVHAGEWVASQRLTKNRHVRPIIEALDFAQRNNKVGSLSNEYVTKTITAPTVLAESFKDYRQAPKKVIVENQPAQTQSPQSERALADYAETMRLLRQRLDEPFVTVNSVTGDIGMKQAQDEYDKLIRNKTPKSRRK